MFKRVHVSVAGSYESTNVPLPRIAASLFVPPTKSIRVPVHTAEGQLLSVGELTILRGDHVAADKSLGPVGIALGPGEGAGPGPGVSTGPFKEF